MTALDWTTEAPKVAGFYFLRHASLDSVANIEVFTDRYWHVASFQWDGVWTYTAKFTGEWLGPIDHARIVRMDKALRETEDRRDSLQLSMERIRKHASAANSCRAEYGCRGDPAELREAEVLEAAVRLEYMTACGWIEQVPGCWKRPAALRGVARGRGGDGMSTNGLSPERREAYLAGARDALEAAAKAECTVCFGEHPIYNTEPVRFSTGFWWHEEREGIGRTRCGASRILNLDPENLAGDAGGEGT